MGDGSPIFTHEQWLLTKIVTLGTVVELPGEEEKFGQRDEPPP